MKNVSGGVAQVSYVVQAMAGSPQQRRKVPPADKQAPHFRIKQSMPTKKSKVCLTFKQK